MQFCQLLLFIENFKLEYTTKSILNTITKLRDTKFTNFEKHK
jgi:hypothetical protein